MLKEKFYDTLARVGTAAATICTAM